jgi:hypothetical protein
MSVSSYLLHKCSYLHYRDDWRAHTTYMDISPVADRVRFFWQCMNGWGDDRKMQLLQSVTGSGRATVVGFRNLYWSGNKNQPDQQFSLGRGLTLSVSPRERKVSVSSLLGSY